QQQWAYGGREQRRSGLAYPALRGVNQLLNASAALAALEALRMQLVVPQQAVRVGLAQVALPGRLQILPGTPTVVLDVAHNPHAAAALAHNLDSMGYFAQTHAVVGMLNDKDAMSVIAKLADRIDRWYCAGLEGPRASSGPQLVEVVEEAVERLKRGELLERPAELAQRQDAGHQSEPQRPGVKPASRPPFNPEAVRVSSFENPVQAFTE